MKWTQTDENEFPLRVNVADEKTLRKVHDFLTLEKDNQTEFELEDYSGVIMTRPITRVGCIGVKH